MFINTPVSGINAAFAGVDAVAHNTANINTDEYKAVRTEFVEDKVHGVNTVYSRNDSAGPQYFDPHGDLREMSNVQFESEAVSLMYYQAMSSMGITLLRVNDEMTGTLVDIPA